MCKPYAWYRGYISHALVRGWLTIEDTNEKIIKFVLYLGFRKSATLKLFFIQVFLEDNFRETDFRKFLCTPHPDSSMLLYVP